MSSVLNGKVFISTRPQGKSKDLQNLLQKHGATLYEMPMIELSENQNTEEIYKILNNLEVFTHIAFTSANGFRYFYDRVSTLSNYKQTLKNIKIASIGYHTTETIKAHGIHINFDGKAKDGKEFAKKLAQEINSQKANILWPTGNLSPNHLVNTLENIAQVCRLNIYKNSAPKNVDKKLLSKIQNGEYDMLLIASPSAFNNLKSYIANKDLNIICIGNTSASSLIKGGTQPKVIASEPSVQGIYEALNDYYSKNLLTK